MMGSNSKLGIFLHLSHALLGTLTLIGFHHSGSLWDSHFPPHLSSSSTKKSCQGQTSAGGVIQTATGDLCGGGGGVFLPASFTGTLWTLTLGLVGLCGLGVLITIWAPQFLKNMLKWYYAGAAFFILFFATTSYNQVGTEFGKCTSSGNCPSFLLPIFLIFLLSVGHTLIFGAGFLIALIDQAKPCSSPTSSASRTCPYICKPPGVAPN